MLFTARSANLQETQGVTASPVGPTDAFSGAQTQVLANQGQIHTVVVLLAEPLGAIPLRDQLPILRVAARTIFVVE